MCLTTNAQVAKCDVYRLEDESEPGGFRYLLGEPFLEGKYLKVNDAGMGLEKAREGEVVGGMERKRN